jgi:hypothetical protein
LYFVGSELALMWHSHCNPCDSLVKKNLIFAGGKMMISRVATAYDQNPARLALVLKRRRKIERKNHRAMVSILISIGMVALYAVNHLPG